MFYLKAVAQSAQRIRFFLDPRWDEVSSYETIQLGTPCRSSQMRITCSSMEIPDLHKERGSNLHFLITRICTKKEDVVTSDSPIYRLRPGRGYVAPGTAGIGSPLNVLFLDYHKVFMYFCYEL